MEASRHVPTAGLKGPLGIGAKMALLVCGAVALTNVVGGTWSYQRLRGALVRQELIREDAAADAVAPRFGVSLGALREDAAFLAAVPSIAGVVRAMQNRGFDRLESSTGQQWKQRLSVIFRERLRSRPDYLQIRLIGVADGGLEIVRVERQGNNISRVPDGLLQKKGDRPYLRNTLQLPAGQVHLSEIELNEEWGHVAEPRIPVIRAASPVTDAGGQTFGIVVINLDLRPTFAAMRAALPRNYSLYLTNGQGDFLVHPNPNLAFGFQVSKPYRVADEFPSLLAGEEGQEKARTVENAPTTGLVIANFSKLHCDPARPERWWGLLLTSDYGDAIAPSVVQRNEAILFTALLVSVTLGSVLLLSRHFTRPLREITAAVEAFGQGNDQRALPLKATDEAGVLARAFDTMTQQVNENRRKLESEIGERRHAEEALRENDRRLRLALDASQAGIWDWDIGQDTGTWDERMARLFDIDPASFKPSRESWQALLHPDDRDRAEQSVDRAMQGNQTSYEVEYRARGRNKRWRHFKTRAIVVRDERGEPVKVVRTCWDITASKLAEKRIQEYSAELERKNREMEQFVYSVSHDLKSPLVTCKGFLGILREDLQEKKLDQVFDSIERMEQATRRMGHLIEDLLQLSRIGRASDEPATIDISPLVAELARELAAQFNPGVEVVVQPGMPHILAGPVGITRLFQNLISNAFKYGSGAVEPRIEIGGQIGDEGVLFFVRDNGCGIPEEYQHKIFGLFQRLDTSQEGTGIGLAIVSKIMEVHGGRAWVESKPNQGTTFWLSFPGSLVAPSPPIPALTGSAL